MIVMFNNSTKTDEGWSPDDIDQSLSAINIVKKRRLRAMGMLRMLKVLRAVGLLALFSALVMEFHRGTPIANEGGGGGGTGGGGNASVFIRGGSGGGGIAAEMTLEASSSAVTERNDAADYENKSHEQTQGLEPSKQPVLISVQAAHPSKSTTPVEQIVLLGERHSGTELIADHLAKCFEVKVSVRPRFLLARVSCGIRHGELIRIA
jgi:hypothetical protein